MTDLAASVVIQDVAGSTVLALAAPTYQLVSITMPDRTWRRVVVNSMDVEGDVEMQSVLDSGTYQIELRCVATTTAAVETARKALLTAVEQRNYRIAVTIDGVTKTWLARRADSVTDQTKFYLMAFMRPMTLSIPVQPTIVEDL